MKQKVDLLIVSPVPTHPPGSGNRMRIKNLLHAFDALGLEWFLLVVSNDAEVRTEMLSAWGDRVDFTVPIYKQRGLIFRIRAGLKKLLSKARKPHHYKVDSWREQHTFDEIAHCMKRFEPKGVWVEYVFMSKCFEFVSPDIPKFLDTHDVFADRRKIYERVNRKPGWFYTTSEEEKKGCLRADYVIAIQDQEKDVFSSYGCKAAVVSHFLEIVPASASQKTEPTICFVGSAYVANVDAINYFLADIFPAIRESCPGVRVEIYGDVCLSLDAHLPSDVFPMGRVEDLSQAYQNAWVVIAPIRMGSGLKIKSIESLSRGRALVGTEEGTVGMGDGRDSGFLTARSSEEFARNCILLLTDANYRREMEKKAVSYCQEWNKTQSKELARILSESKILNHEVPNRAIPQPEASESSSPEYSDSQPPFPLP